jgi:hypothetical protein
VTGRTRRGRRRGSCRHPSPRRAGSQPPPQCHHLAHHAPTTPVPGRRHHRRTDPGRGTVPGRHTVLGQALRGREPQPQPCAPAVERGAPTNPLANLSSRRHRPLHFDDLVASQ